MKLALLKRPFAWILIGFIAYAYISNPNKRPKPPQETPETAAVEDEVSVSPDQKEPGIIDKPVDKLVKTLVKTDTGKAFVRAMAEQSLKKKYGDADVSASLAQEKKQLLTIDRLSGEGAFAHCGSTVTIRYDAYTDQGITIDSTKTGSPLTFTVGDHRVIPGLENGIIGMKKGGVRRIAIPSYLAYDGPTFDHALVKDGTPLLMDVEMVQVEAGQQPTSATIVIQDITPGSGDTEVICGSNVGATYRITTSDGKEAHGALAFQVGKGTVPQGIERGVIGMKAGGVRNLTIPQELLTFNGTPSLPASLVLPKEGSLIIELTLTGMGIGK